MRIHLIKSVSILAGSLLMITAFQNCGQAGSITAASLDSQKVSDPLVADVVAEIENQEVVLPPAADDSASDNVADDSANNNDPNVPDNSGNMGSGEVVQNPPAQSGSSEDGKDCDHNSNAGSVKSDDQAKNDSQQQGDMEQIQPIKDDRDKKDIEIVMDDYSCPDSKGDLKDKIMICHIPPGNPSARKSICISRAALAAHMDHGQGEEQDHLGSCK